MADKIIVGLMLFFLGIAPLDVQRLTYAHFLEDRVAVIDLVFAAYFLVVHLPRAMTSTGFFRPRSLRHGRFLKAMWLFTFWTGLSFAYTAIVSGDDLFHLFGTTIRFSLYLLLSMTAVDWARRFGPAFVAGSYSLGIVFWFGINFNAAFLAEGSYRLPDYVYGSNNLSGVLLPTGVIMIAIASLRQGRWWTDALQGVLLLLPLLVFSLGAYLLMTTASVAMFVTMRRSLRRDPVTGHRRAPVGAILMLVALAVVAVNLAQFNEAIVDRVEKKLANIPLGDKNSIQSGDERFWQAASSVAMAVRSPLFGVGGRNWERYNDDNESWLGTYYMKNDNPHNGFAEIVSYYGFPAFFLFCAGLTYLIGQLRRLPHASVLVTLATAMVLIGGGLTMDVVYTYTPTYILAALVFAQATDDRKAPNGTPTDGRAALP